jgi:hypothetical protein
MLTAFCDLHSNTCDAYHYTNLYPGSVNTNLFNNNVMVLPIPLTLIGLVDGTNTDFKFYVVSYSREAPGAVDSTGILTYEVAHQSFTAVDPVDTETPLWADSPTLTPAFKINYDKAAIDANDTLGLLLLHLHNNSNNAVVLRFTYNSFLPIIGK